MTDTATVVSPGLPQTTVEPPGGPFIRHSEPGKARLYDLVNTAGSSFGGVVTQPLPSVPGYAARFRVFLSATGGANGNSTVVAIAADAPYNAIQLITVWDALGTPIYSLPGYEGMKLVPMFSGQFGLRATTDIANLPSFVGVGTGSASATGTGNFTFASVVPFEFAKGYGVIGMADGDVLPKMQVQFNGSASVFTTAPPTLPTLEWRVNCDYYWLPVGDNVEPVGLGSTCQWFLQQGNPAPASAATSTITIPRQGGWLSTIILILRDSTSARIDNFPSVFRFNIDGIGEISTNLDEIKDDMAIAWGVGEAEAGGVARPTGVLALSRKTSLGLQVHGLMDTLEVALSSSPGTSMTVEGAPWGTFANTPGTLNAVLGQIIPSGPLAQGFPEQ